MIKIHHIHIWKKLIKSVYGSDYFFSLYFTYFPDLLSKQSQFFVQQIFVLHMKFFISSFLAASRTCMMETLEVIDDDLRKDSLQPV